ncbi:formylglycine-generating enzyme family protein [Zestomonas carbonaria]|uniref:Sulfatase-modifying factor enzyme-like domain-containing protein n=1 Tax=Zestomonas carbonaria TaxID=2762745 RepID=A0A7U7I8C1_9GAMM|nr:SUMF1/EgtB/PvdO family nonheme iron enzyme [Pseudomonas carbonaria]CAD5107169.1 hypothetical protein PSEWESI4_01440 [Pseudomonas carbonaria]
MRQALKFTVPVLLALAVAGTLFIAQPTAPDPELVPETVRLEAREHSYRPAGDYWRHGKPVDPPLRHEFLDPGFDVMKYQVSQAEYGRCVEAGACLPLDGLDPSAGDLPVTGVSLLDAQLYADWLSARTGQRWRLPSDREWAFFAASRWSDDALLLDEDDSNPARRWLARYRFEAELASDGPAQPQPRGSHGVNELGVADLSGNVWEWTLTCYDRVTLDEQDIELGRVEACAIKVAQGRHRAALNEFVRDARVGGCGAGQPPDNLGFRLVRELP